jgi:ATP-dependent DNA helicase RecQ
MNILFDLRRLHGFQSFRDGQQESLRSILDKRDTLSILPTSTGKSLIYFMAANYYRKMYPSKFVVICSPLISLMKDQVSSTPIYLKSTLLGSGQLDKDVENKVWKNYYDIVYISPERLSSMVCPNMNEFISLLVVDEAHCVSQDGSTYRPSYLNIGQIRREFLPNVPILALTATATTKTQRDIISLLKLNQPKIVHVGMDRPNLHYIFNHRDIKNPIAQIMSYQPKMGQTIIYCTTRKECESVASQLTKNGWVSKYYHAGLCIPDREDILKSFLMSEFTCIVATISFGLGVNIPNVRLVINIGISRSISAFLQETGRAGRDGKNSQCVLLYNKNDLCRYMRIVDTKHERNALIRMDTLVRTPGCRRKNILSCFQPKHTSTYAPSDKCHGCDVCDGNFVDLSKMIPPQKDISTSDHVPDLHKRLLLNAIIQTGNYHGILFPIDYVRGSNQKNMQIYIKKYKHDPCSVHGKGKRFSKQYWKNVHMHMVEQSHELSVKYTKTGNRVYSVKL